MEIIMKRIALIHDLSGFGKCSLTAAIPVVSIMGIQACPLPTAILSSQTGFSSYCFFDFTEKMNQFTDEWAKLEVSFDGISSGFLGNASQIHQVLYFLEHFQNQNSIYLADPVLGDNGKMIKSFNQELLQGMRTLVSKSDICTPNLTELCLLTDKEYSIFTTLSCKEDYLKYVTDYAHLLLEKAENKKQQVLVTGLVYTKNSTPTIGNLAVSKECSIYKETIYTGKGFSGTGDLYATVICAGLTKGLTLEESMEKASDFLQPAIEEASLLNIPSTHGVFFEKYLNRLL